MSSKMKDITNTKFTLPKNYKKRPLTERPLRFPSSETQPIKKQKQKQKQDFEIRNHSNRNQNNNENTLIPDMRSHSYQLERVLSEKQSSKDKLNRLQSELWSIRTDIPELELNLEKTNDEFRKLEREYKLKEAELWHLDSERDKRVNELQFELEIFKKDEESKFNSKMDSLVEKYVDEAQRLIDQKQNLRDKSKEDLIRELNETKKDQDEISTLLIEQSQNLKRQADLKLTEMKLEHKTKKQNIKNMIRTSTSTIESSEREIEGRKSSIKKDDQLIHDLTLEYNIVKANSNQFEEQTSLLRSEIDQLVQEVSEKNQYLSKLKTESHKFIENTKQLKEKLMEEEIIRRKLHNQLQELKGNIRVFCRIKPDRPEVCFPFEASFLMESTDGKEHLQISEVPATDQRQLNFSNKTTTKSFNFGFDKVFDTSSSNSEIFEEISQLVQSALDGYNVCIFTYGQTGSGKTFTMSNPGDGMIPRSVKLIFDKIETLKSLQWDYQVHGQFLEIYNENINDLMTDSYLKNLDKIKHQIKHDEVNLSTSVTDLTNISLSNADQVASILETANRNRITASTNANHRSSRSHSVFIISITGYNPRTGESTSGKLNLIDLAGSERISQSLVTGDRLRETQSINKSLSSLGDVIISLGNKKSQHVPYRNSKLTYLLQYSLGGNSKTLMFVNVSPNAKHFNETLNSLRFATKVNNTHIGQATKN